MIGMLGFGTILACFQNGQALSRGKSRIGKENIRKADRAFRAGYEVGDEKEKTSQHRTLSEKLSFNRLPAAMAMNLLPMIGLVIRFPFLPESPNDG